MKNLVKILTAISIFAVVNCASQASFAQKHSKRVHSDYVNSYRPSYHSNYLGNCDEGKWKFGADFGMTLDIRSATISGTTDPILKMLGSMSGITPFFNFYADYSISEKIGIQTKNQLGLFQRQRLCGCYNPWCKRKYNYGPTCEINWHRCFEQI